jgi:hypothetical protein
MSEPDFNGIQDMVAHVLANKVFREMRFLRRKGLSDQEIYHVISGAVEFLLNHEEDR